MDLGIGLHVWKYMYLDEIPLPQHLYKSSIYLSLILDISINMLRIIIALELFVCMCERTQACARVGMRLYLLGNVAPVSFVRSVSRLVVCSVGMQSS